MENIKIYCENDACYHSFPMGTDLKSISEAVCPSVPCKNGCDRTEVLAALVDNQLKELSFKVMATHNVKFVGYGHPDGRRTYIRSLCFVLQNVIREKYPDKVLVIDYSLPSGLYCEIREKNELYDGRPKVYFATDEEIESIQARMNEIIDADQPFVKSNLKIVALAHDRKSYISI